MKTNIFLITVSVVLFFASIFRIPSTSKGRSSIPLSEPRFKKLIYLVIDGLRFDGYVPVEKSGYYYNNFTFARDPERLKTTFFSLSAIPTCTTCRIIGLMSGSPSNQVEELMTFFISKLNVESLPDKLSDRTMHHYGDSVWPQSFEVLRDKSHSFCGLSKGGLVENEVELIEKILGDKVSEVKFIHTICLDALGHIYTTEHQEIKDSMKRMDDLLHKLYNSMDEDTLLVVTSDHGVTDTGAHGGNSAEELASVCGFYSKRPFAEDSSNPLFENMGSVYNTEFLMKFCDREYFNQKDDWIKAKHPYKVVYQDDILPTVAYLMGIPTPINTYGNLIPHLIRNEQSHKILAQQKRLIAGRLEDTSFPDVLAENYYLTNTIYGSAVKTNALFAMLSALIGLSVLARILNRSHRLVPCFPFVITTIMVSLSYWCFASEDIFWVLTFLLTNFSYANLIFSIWYLKSPGRVFFQKDRLNLHLGGLENPLEAAVLIGLFFIFKNMTASRKRFLDSGPHRKESSADALGAMFYHNTLFWKQISENAVHFAIIAYEAVFGCDRLSKICLLCLYPSFDTLVCIHFDPIISTSLLYFVKNLDLSQNLTTKYILLSLSPYLVNTEKVVQSIDFKMFFVLGDSFGSVANAIGAFTYAVVPRILIHKHFKVASFGLALSLFGLYFCFACSWVMHGSLVFQYFFVGRLLFVTGFFACDLLIEGAIIALERLSRTGLIIALERLSRTGLIAKVCN